MLLGMLLLLSVFVVTPPPGYEEVAKQIPPEHWALIEHIEASEKNTVGKTKRSRPFIQLPVWSPRRSGTLKHEVGHVVFNTNPKMLEDFRQQFWPNGTPKGTPCFGPSHKVKNYREDAAECYEAYLDNRGDLEDSKRETFMRERVFQQAWRNK